MPSHPSTFPISNSRILPLPPPLMTSNIYNGQSLPGITTPQQYHTTANDHVSNTPLSPTRYYYSQNQSDGYFPSVSGNSASHRHTRSNSKTSLHSISSLLSSAATADPSSETPSPSTSPHYYSNCYWSGASPTTTTATTPRTSSVVSTPLSAGFGPVSEEYGSESSSYTTGDYAEVKEEAIEGSGKRKIRSSPRTIGNINTSKENNSYNKDDEYDVLGRKKPKTPRTPMSWDPQDDILLKELKEEQRLGWKEIATHFPGRTSHACQFRWRRLVSGTLKYYQGHRRPPVVTTTSSSFASEMAASTVTSHTISAPSTPAVSRFHPMPVSPAPSPHNNHIYSYDRTPYQHRSSFSAGSFSLPSPASSSPQQHGGSPMALPGTPCTPPPHTPGLYSMGSHCQGSYGTLGHPHYLSTPAEEDYDDEDGNWTAEEDALLMDRKLCFDEVNVLLRGRGEPEIVRRMGKLRKRWGRVGSESSASGESDIGTILADSPRGFRLPPVIGGRSQQRVVSIR